MDTMKFITLKVSTFASENEFLFDNVRLIIPYIRKKCYSNFQGSISVRFYAFQSVSRYAFYECARGFTAR